MRFKSGYAKHRNGYVSGTKLQSTLRELQDFAQSRHFWTVFSALVILFTAAGPFGTSEHMALGPRFGFWLINLASGTAIAVIFATVAANHLESIIESRFWRMLAGSILASLPIGLTTMLLLYSWHGSEISWREFLKSTASALPLCAILPLIYWAAMRHEDLANQITGKQLAPQAPANEAEAQTSPPLPEPTRELPALLARLNPENRGPILRLSAEDHYTNTLTTRGRELLLIRFSDALQELGDTEGMQIHRSHWIARAHLEKLASRDGKLMAVLKDGSELPVSRSYAKTARELAASWV
jgi:DNA-binding LytR/AlgR family response regulator